MKFRDLAILFVIGLVFTFGIAYYQSTPGYMDADYYYAGGLRLARGQGFTETYLWNYLDNPQKLPHPSHGYWFPLASIIAAIGMFLTGQKVFWAARLGFILIAAMAPPVTALVGYRLTSQRAISFAAGLLAVFSGYHAPFLPTTDNFGLFMLLGGLFFLTISRQGRWSAFLLGLIAGLMNLARVDGLIWLALGALGLFSITKKQNARINPSGLFSAGLLLLAGYLLVMGPWMVRNISIWGTPFTPAGGNVLWMTRYDDTFAWPASRISFQSWMASGWRSALDGRMNALKLNLINTIGAQSSFLLFPFILTGLWALRKDLRVRLAALGWIILLFMMSFIFPFAGSRGSFFHAGAAMQPIWFTAAVVGVDVIVSKARAGGRFNSAASGIFRAALVVCMAGLTIWLGYIAIIEKDWNRFKRDYTHVEGVLLQNGAQANDVVMVANAPGYYAITERSAVIVPDENLESVHKLAQVFGAKFLVLEKKYYTDPLIPIFDKPEAQPGLVYLGEYDDVRIFKILP